MRVSGARQRRRSWGSSACASRREAHAPPPSAPRQTAAVTASEVILPRRVFREQTRRAPAGADKPTSAHTSRQMTPLCPRPALRHHFFTSLFRPGFKDACSAGRRAEAAGPLFRPLSSTRSLSRGCRGTRHVRAQAGRTRCLEGRGEAGSPADPPRSRWGRRGRRGRRRGADPTSKPSGSGRGGHAEGAQPLFARARVH